MFTICEICPADHLKAEKNKGLRKQFPRYLQGWVFFLYLKFGPINFSYQRALGRAQICLTVQQILRNSTEGNAINPARMSPIFSARISFQVDICFRYVEYLPSQERTIL